MACCGRKNPQKRTMVHNSKLCPKCGWLLNQVHKFNGSRNAMIVYQLCSNKQCRYKQIQK